MFDLFFQASFLVKMVICCLGVGSCVSWAIMGSKAWEVWQDFTGMQTFSRFFASAWTPNSLYTYTKRHLNQHSLHRFLRGGFSQLSHSTFRTPQDLEALFLFQSRLVEHEDRLRHDTGLAYLSVIASLSPFVGLLGTVWGIMTSFRDIGAAKSVQLTVVAPGLSEALYTTALGLCVAIPASIGITLLSYYHTYYKKKFHLLSLKISHSIAGKLHETL